MILTFILESTMETALRQALVRSEGDFSILITQPISDAFLAVSLPGSATAGISGLGRHLPFSKVQK